MPIEPTDLFTAISHPTRLRCLLLLLRFEELCVCEFTGALGAAQPHVSRHLAQLRAAQLVADRRDGLWIHYRVHPGLADWAWVVLRATAAETESQSPYQEDAMRVAAQRGSGPHCAPVIGGRLVSTSSIRVKP